MAFYLLVGDPLSVEITTDVRQNCFYDFSLDSAYEISESITVLIYKGIRVD